MPIQSSLLLPQGFSLYVKRQGKHYPGAEINKVANAFGFHRIKHPDDQICNVPLQLDTASQRGYTVHPADMFRNALCPVCEVKAHLYSLHAIKVAWGRTGGPRPKTGRTYPIEVIFNLNIYITDDEDAFDSSKTNPHFFSNCVSNQQGDVGLLRLEW